MPCDIYNSKGMFEWLNKAGRSCRASPSRLVIKRGKTPIIRNCQVMSSSRGLIFIF